MKFTEKYCFFGTCSFQLLKTVTNKINSSKMKGVCFFQQHSWMLAWVQGIIGDCELEQRINSEKPCCVWGFPLTVGSHAYNFY